jgi:potassium/chloride transporter 4/5/6
MIGSIDGVAPLCTVFFLLCYSSVNLACFLLDWLGSPNWRPTWKYYNQITAFSGVALCVGIMIMINWWVAMLSIIGAMGLYAYIEQRTHERDWGDGIEGMRAERARNALLKLDKYKKHVKNWKPHYLALGYVNEAGKISSPGIFKLLY